MAGSTAPVPTDAPSHEGHVLLNALALHSAADAARVFLENLISGLPRAWPEARLTVVVRAGTRVPPLGGRVRVVELGSAGSGVVRVVDELVRLPRLIRQVAPDVVLNPNESIPPMIDVPLVVVAQNLLFHCPRIGPLPRGPLRARVRSRLQFAFYRWRMPRAYARATAVIPVSAHAAGELARQAGLDLSRVHVVPYGADRLPVLARVPAPDGRRRLLVVGAIAHYKRLERVVEALACLERAGSDYELVLAGEGWPGYKDVLRSVATSAGVSDRVHFAGAVGGEELARLFASSHAGLSLSACESFGIPVVEGMHAGLPQVVADESWSAETVGEDVVRVDANDPVSVVAGVRRLEDPATWSYMAERGRRRAAGYTWEANAAGIARVVARVAARRQDG